MSPRPLAPERPLTRPLRTLVVTPSGVLGGAESWLLSQLDHTDRLAVEAIVLADGPMVTELTRRGIPTVVRPTGAGRSAVAGAGAWLRRELRRREPDVIVANGVKAAAVVCPVAALEGVPSVWVKHDHSFDGRWSRLFGRLASAVVTTGPDLGATAGRPVTVVEPPRPEPPLRRAEATARLVEAGLRVPDGAPLLLTVGRYVRYKGADTAIRALAEPAARGWHLAVVGPDDPSQPGERDRLGKLAAELGVADRVQLLGFVADAGRLLAAGDAVAVLTRPDGARSPGREGFGLTALEASLAGVPVVATDDGGPVARRVAGGGEPAGLVVAPDDPRAVADALGTLADPGRRAELGAAGWRRSASHPDAAATSRRFVRVLAETAHRLGAGLTAGPPLSIVTPVLNEAPNLEHLLRPVVTQLGRDDEYLLVDGGSTDGTVEALAAWQARDPRLRVIDDAGGNIAHSRNAGIRAARHAYVACTDAGCDPDPGWVAAMRAAAAESAQAARDSGGGSDGPALFLGVYRVGIRGGVFEQAMAAAAGPDLDELRRPRLGRRVYGALLGRRTEARRVEGRSVGFRRAAWEAAGGWPEHLATAEDEAFGRAVAAHGGRLVLTHDPVVTWYQRPTPASTFRQYRGYGRGGGTSRSPLLLARDGVRVVAYAGGVAAVALGGWRGAAAVAAGGLAYLSLPIGRVLRRGQSPRVLLAVPFCVALKDAGKVLGTAEALLAGVGARPAQETAPGRDVKERP